MKENTPLVSVVVLTYNSSATILETLFSIKKQVYPNIELVVSDDCSTDETVEIVKKWISENKSFFYDAKIVRSFKNIGTCKNYNHGIINSNGVYIKTLDGDDLLNSSHAISKYVDYLQTNKFDICIADVELFSVDVNCDMTAFRSRYDYYMQCVNENLIEQKKRIDIELALPNPALFFSRRLYDLVDGFDETYKLQEEWPFFMKVLDNDIQVAALNEKLVGYRFISSSATHGAKKSRVRKICLMDNILFFWKIRIWRLLKRGLFWTIIKQNIHYLIWYIEQL